MSEQDYMFVIGGGGKFSMGKSYVLILDELRQSTQRLRQCLNAVGYDSALAHTLHELYQFAKMQRPDAIVVWDNVQKLEGVKICEELRSESDTCYANIILLVPALDHATEESARIAGVNKVLEKNIDEQKLCDQIQMLLGSEK